VALYENISYLKDGKQQQITLMKMRNPWGKGTWKGDWSFDSNMWTPDLRMKLGYIKDPKKRNFLYWNQRFFDNVWINESLPTVTNKRKQRS
jgi:hypothetical protein